MKHLKKLLLILLVVVSFNNINAQDEDNPWAIELATNSVDFFPTGGDQPYIGDMFEDFTNVSDHWNNGAIISRLRVSKHIGNGFTVGIAGSFNSISKIGNLPTNTDKTYFGADLDVRYSFIKKSWFDPYISVGGGYTWFDSEATPTFNGGLGFNFWFNDNIAFNIGSTYKHSFDDDKMLAHFQHNAGIVFKFGGKDTDGDGIYDKYDACPETAGLEAFNGCPDSDSDGIQDSEDACPNVAGLPALNGCPDADGDGIADKDDACPKEAGTAANNGCPDADGDGVVDKDDDCPNQAGPAENKGCPWPDADGDGILDKDDNCPNVIGVAENHGCPIVTEEVQKEINILAREVFFNTGKITFTDETSIRLDGISKILMEFKTLNFEIGGHTDSTGSKKTNERLSKERAEAVMNFLISKGFPAENIKAVGYGPSNPIGSNKTRKGRQQNRRVEVVYKK